MNCDLICKMNKFSLEFITGVYEKNQLENIYIAEEVNLLNKEVPICLYI